MKYFCYSFFIIIIFFNATATATDKLIVAVYLEPPYTNLVENELVGENIDIINFLAKSIQLKPTFLLCPFVRCLAMMKNGQADLILAISKSPEREKDLLFLNPPYLVQQQPLRFFTLKENSITIRKFSDLDSLLVGAIRGATYFPLFDKNKKIKKVELTSSEQLMNMLLKGRIDTLIDREESVLPLLSTAEYQNKLTMADYQYNKPINSYIALSKHSSITMYVDRLSKILTKALDDGTIDAIQKKNRKIFTKEFTAE